MRASSCAEEAISCAEALVSCVVAENGAVLEGAEVIAWLRERLAAYKVPRKVLFVSEEELGMTGTAKIKPAEVRELAARVERGEASLRGRSLLETLDEVLPPI